MLKICRKTDKKYQTYVNLCFFREKYLKICSYKLDSFYSEFYNWQKYLINIPTSNQLKKNM